MNKLRTLQQLVGGDMQAVYPWSKDDVALICNDSGKVDGLPLNRSLEDYDIIAGNFFICGFSGEEFCSLTDKQFRYYEKLFRDPELFLPTPIGIMGIALSIEHGQGYSCRSHILAAVPWRIVAASLEQLQHYCPVSKFRGGFGCGICICVAQIVAVGGVVISLAVAYDFTNIIATSDFADIIAVENSSGKIITADTAGVAKIAKENEYITKKNVMEKLRISANQAGYLLKKLVASGDLEIVTHGRYSKYQITSIA